MIDDWVDLAYVDNDPTHAEYNELKAWLRSQTQNTEATVSHNSHPLGMLRAALQAAAYEIRDNLDYQIEVLVREACEQNIRVRQRDYYRTRIDDWDGMLPTDIDEMGVEECLGLMRAAKEEVTWLCNEISRLQCYISVEQQMKKHGVQDRHSILRPLERKPEQRDNTPVRNRVEMDLLKSMDSGLASTPMSPSAGVGD